MDILPATADCAVAGTASPGSGVDGNGARGGVVAHGGRGSEAVCSQKMLAAALVLRGEQV
jgi:hypothetical protein